MRIDNSYTYIYTNGIIKSVALLLAMMTGLGMMAQGLEAEQTDLHLGNVRYRKPVTAVFKLTNTSAGNLKIDRVEVSCGCLEADYPKGEIIPGTAFDVRLTYDAKQLGHFYKEACLTIEGYENEPMWLSMRGVVMDNTTEFRGSYAHTIGAIGTDVRDIMFDDVNKGDMPRADIHIVNRGTETLEPVLMHLPSYMEAEIKPRQLGPGKSGRIRLTLNSQEMNGYGIGHTSIYLANGIGEDVGPDNEIGITTVLLPSFGSMTPAERINAPHLTLSADRLLVDFEGKAKKTEKILLTNTGKSTLDISSIHLMTPALQVTLSSQSIAPGEVATMKVTISKTEADKATEQPRIIMITNDPDKPKVVIDVETK